MPLQMHMTAQTNKICLPVQDAAEERWGDATTDESDSELTHYRSKRAEALEASASVFADASEEYGSLPAVKDRLEKWKQQQPGAYADAYMNLSVPAVMAPFVRLELLRWDPLFGSSTGWLTLPCASMWEIPSDMYPTAPLLHRIVMQSCASTLRNKKQQWHGAAALMVFETLQSCQCNTFLCHTQTAALRCHTEIEQLAQLCCLHAAGMLSNFCKAATETLSSLYT